MGDKIRYVGLIFPSFCVTHAVLISQNLPILYQTRTETVEDKNSDFYGVLPPIDDDLWAWPNLKADFAALLGHFVIGFIFLAILESPMCARFKECSCIDFVNFKDLMDLDDDVVDEEERVDRMNTEAEYKFKSESFVN